MPFSTPSAVFLVATAAYLGVRGYYKRKAPRKTVVVGRSSGADMALVLLVGCGQILLPLLALFTPILDGAHYRSPTLFLDCLGALLMAAGLWLFWRSHADLGDNWSVTLEVLKDHRLVSDGVYRRIRHPMYASFLAMALGQWLLLPNWIAGPAALSAVACLYVIRRPHEEAMLLDTFGDEYRQYMNATGGIWPKFGASSGARRAPR